MTVKIDHIAAAFADPLLAEQSGRLPGCRRRYIATRRRDQWTGRQWAEVAVEGDLRLYAREVVVQSYMLPPRRGA